MTQIPSGNYSNLVSGYFGLNQTGGINFSQADANMLWSEFLTQNGITNEEDFTNPPWATFLKANNINPQTATQAQLDAAYADFLNQPSLQVAFSRFLQTTYTNLGGILNLSPDEIANRKLVITVIDMLISLIATMQDSISTVSKNISIQGQIQSQYTEEMDKIPIYMGGSDNNAVVNSTSLSNWTLGYAHISMQDYLSAAVAGGPATNSSGGVITPGVGPQLILGNISNLAQIQNNYNNLTSTNASTVTDYLKSILPNGNSLDATESNTVVALATALAITNGLLPLPSLSPISWAGKDSNSVQNPVNSPSDFANIPDSWFNWLIFANEGGGFLTGTEATNFFQNTLLPALRTAATNAYNASITSQGAIPVGLSFQQFQSNNTLTISFTNAGSTVTQNVTFSPDETYVNKLAAADAAFSTLLTKTIGTSTVLSMITAADLHTDWNAILNTKFTTNPSDAATSGDIQKRAQQNQLLQQYIQADKVKQQVVANVLNSEQTVLNQFQQGLTQAGQIISTSIQQLENILGAIYRPK